MTADHEAEARRVMVEAYRTMTPAQKLAIVDGMWRSARALIAAEIRTRHPDWPEARIKSETTARVANGAA